MEAPSLPPGPTLLPRLAQTLIGGMFPLETLTAARRRYGDVFRVKNIAYDDPLVYVCHPELSGRSSGEIRTFCGRARRTG